MDRRRTPTFNVIRNERPFILFIIETLNACSKNLLCDSDFQYEVETTRLTHAVIEIDHSIYSKSFGERNTGFRYLDRNFKKLPRKFCKDAILHFK